MGKGILFIVAAALLGASFAMYSTQQLTLDLDTTLSEVHESQVIAREMARSAMNMAAGEAHRDWDEAVNEINQAMHDVEHEGGSYQASASLVNSTMMELDVTGTYGEKSYRIKRSLVLAGPLDAAVVFDAQNADVAFGSNSFLIDGTDRRPPSMGGTGTTLMHKIGFVTNTTTVLEEFGNSVGGNSSRVRGVRENDEGEEFISGASMRQLSDWQAVDLDELYRELTEDHSIPELDANIVGDPAPYSIGTPENPVLRKVSTNTTISGTVTGYGLLLVEGDLNISGNFTWEGIVFVYDDDSDLNLTYGGEATIYGSLIAIQRDDWAFAMPEDGRLKVTYKYSSAGFGSEVWVEPWGESPDLLFERGSNRNGDQMEIYDVVFPKGQRLNFFINVQGCTTATTSCWPKHYWDHYAVGDESPSGQPYGNVIQLDEYKWEIQFEDLPEGHPWEDWDYNDQVIEVEIIPEEGILEDDNPWWTEGDQGDDDGDGDGDEGTPMGHTLNFAMADDAKVLYSAEAIARVGSALNVQVIKKATRVVVVDNWEIDPSDEAYVSE